VIWLLLIIVFLTVVLAVWQSIQIHQVRQSVRSFPRDGNVAALLRELDARLTDVEEDAQAREGRLADVEARLPSAISRTGVVSYDAFGNIAGRLSRSIAMLSERGDGVVISLLVAREETRFFTKDVRSGRGSEPLSPEEQAAIDRAMAG
jgi:hypothetical protein